MSYSSMYTQKIMQGYHCKDFSEKLVEYTGQCEVVHKACSDKAFVMILVDDSRIIKKIHLDVRGCILAVGAANVVGQYCVNKSADEILTKTNEDIIEMLFGPELINSRLECASLGLSAIRKLL